MWWLEYVVNLTLGFAHQGVSVLFPFRKQTEKPEIAWDVIGMLASGIFATAFYFCFDPAFRFLEQMHWLADWQQRVAQWPSSVSMACYFVAQDFAVYLSHRLLHSRWLWATHAWHHAPRYVYWVAGLRASPLHIVFTLAPASLLYPFFPLPGFGVVLSAVWTFHTINQHYLHSNIWVPAQRQLEWLFVTPRFHFVHHSSTSTRTNSNYGFVFSIWDRLFGTYVDPDTVPADDPLGLNYEISNSRLLLGLPPRHHSPRRRLKQSPT